MYQQVNAIQNISTLSGMQGFLKNCKQWILNFPEKCPQINHKAGLKVQLKIMMIQECISVWQIIFSKPP